MKVFGELTALVGKDFFDPHAEHVLHGGKEQGRTGGTIRGIDTDIGGSHRILSGASAMMRAMVDWPGIDNRRLHRADAQLKVRNLYEIMHAMSAFRLAVLVFAYKGIYESDIKSRAHSQ